MTRTRSTRSAPDLRRDPIERSGSAHVSDGIRYTNADGLGVVLDLRTARYLVLDAAATALFEHLTVGRDVDAPPDAVRSFEVRCRARGWLVDEPLEPQASIEPRHPERGTRGPAFAAAVSSLRWARRALREGFQPAYELLRAERGHGASSPIEPLLQTFRRAETLVTFDSQPDDCLPRSMALYHFLVRRGVEVRHVIGVRRVPFAAHAWVEHDGEPLLDPRVETFVPLAIVRPS